MVLLSPLMVAFLGTLASSKSIPRGFSSSAVQASSTQYATSTSRSALLGTSTLTTSYSTSTSTSTATTTSYSNPNMICTAGDTSSTVGVQALQNSTGYVSWLDIMFKILPNGESDWVDKLWITVFPNQGASPLSGCGQIGSDCNPVTLCQDYSSDMAYWTFYTVGMLHSKINVIHERLLWTGWLDSLSIDQISKDFSYDLNPKPIWAKWVSAAFSMASAVASGADLATTEIRGMISFAGAAFTMVGDTSDTSNDVDTASIELFLQSVVKAAGDNAASILANATGSGDPSLLPIYTESDDEYATARFFEDDTILLEMDIDNGTFTKAYDIFTDNIQQKIVDEAMYSIYYQLYGDDSISESDCNSKTGREWLYGPGPAYAGDKWACFYLRRPKDSTSGCETYDPIETCKQGEFESLSDDLNGKLVNTYGFDLSTYFASIIDCYENAPYVDGTGFDYSVDMTHFTNNGQIPRCFFAVSNAG